MAFQRRNFVRADMVLPVQIIEDDLTSTVAFTKDLSGGMLIVSAKYYKLNDIVHCKISLTEDQVLELYGEVVRVNSVAGSNGSKLYMIGIQFIDVADKLRSQIIQFVYKLQLRAARNQKVKGKIKE